jgi:predicted CxxxxCH...CXXCH cytochrome family protein
MNGKTDFVFSALAKTDGLNPVYAAGQCSSTYCHGASLPGGGSNKAPLWTDTLAGCDSCHGYPPTIIKNGTAHINNSNCKACHTHVNANNTGFTAPGLHINGHVEASAGSCDSCHGYPPAPKNPSVAFGIQNQWSSARFEDYSGGGGAHLVAAHISRNASPSEGWTNCALCHNSGIVGSTPDHKMVLPISNYINNITVAVDPKFRFADSLTIYSSAKLVSPPQRNVTGSCSNINCHMSPSSRWSVER